MLKIFIFKAAYHFSKFGDNTSEFLVVLSDLTKYVAFQQGNVKSHKKKTPKGTCNSLQISSM